MTGQPTEANDRQAGLPPRHDIRNLRRSSTDRVVGGVCGGLGQYTGVDPVVFRIVLAVLAVFGGAGLVLYAVAWLLVPDDTAAESEAQRLLRGRGNLTTLFAIGAVVVGVCVLADLWDRGWPGPLPAVLIIAALLALVVYRRERIRGHGNTPLFRPMPAPGTSPPSEPLGPPAGFAPSRPAGEQGAQFAPPYAAAPYAAAPYAGAPYAGAPYAGASYAPTYAPPTHLPPPSYAPPPFASPPFASPRFVPPPFVPRPPRERSVLAPVGIFAGLVVVGILFALSASHNVSVTAQAIFAAALLTIGVALVVGTWIGRGRGLIAVGVVLTIFLVITAALDVPLRGGIADQLDSPTSAASLHAGYHVGIGRERLDLQGVSLDGVTRRVDVTVGLGQAVVTVPATAKVVLHATVGSGQIRLPSGDELDGGRIVRDVTLPAAGNQSGEIDLDVHVGAGAIEIDRGLQGAQQ